MNVDRHPEPTVERYIEHLLVDAERFAVLLDTEPLDTTIPTCPGWDLSRLAEHTGQIHRWADFCAGRGRRPSQAEAEALESYDATIAADWMRAGANELAATLRQLDPSAPTWHPFPSEQIAQFWPRRQAHETAIHRWDAERACGDPAPIDPSLASDGIDEYFGVVLPRLVAGGRATLPTGSLHVHSTDVPGEWLVWADDDGYQVIRAHQKGDAALRGPAEAILLRLWGRHADDELSPVGDETILAAWLDIGGV